MKTKISSFILVLITTISFGQVKFEKGYIIDNDNRKIDCFIKNYDWRCNPGEIEYKTIDNELVKKGNLLSIKEFGIISNSKYIRANINIDRSSEDLGMLSNQRKPDWHKQQLFLKVLIEGKATLYYYEEEKLKLFFYSVNDSLPQQLIYKSYLDSEGNLATNFGFRQQLWNDIRCNGFTIRSVERINYYKNELEKYFKNYNSCVGDTFVDYSKKPNRDVFNLKIAPGINYSTFSYSNFRSKDNVVFNSTVSFRVGIEAEFILPFNRNKWGIVFEPTYQYFKSQKEVYFYSTATINYGFIEFPIGLRYYSFLNNHLKLFLDGFYISVFDLNFNPSIDFENVPTLDILPSDCLAFGGGVDYKNISVELRYYATKNLLNKYAYFSSDYIRYSIIIGYKLFKTRHNSGNTSHVD